MREFATRLAAVQARIAAAARRAARAPEEITLVGVSKTHPPEAVTALLAAGLAHFGENRVQEAEAKIAALAADRARITWHLIGHLQRNKAAKAAMLFDIVHSVDSLRLAEALNRAVGEQMPDTKPALVARGSLQAADHEPQATGHRLLTILLQVNVSGEASKEGFALAGWEQRPAQLDAFLAEVEVLLALPHIRVGGLMTIAPWGDDPEAARPTFRALRRLRELLAQRYPRADWSALSMGMSDDFAVAIEEGATLVRIGRAIFGEREATG
jgi:pyridoxal phosphate enzyme (YggS family)